MKKTCLIMYFLWALCGQIYAQNVSVKEEYNAIKALNIGDKVPDLSFDLINNAETSVKLSDFKGKLIILDFYGLYCSSCLAKMPENDSLQRVFDDQVQFITVNHVDAPEKIITAFDRFTDSRTSYWGKQKFNWRKSNMLFAVNDKQANLLFPHFTAGHYAIIGNNGRVIAITSLGQINANNIRKILNKDRVEIRQKVDFNGDQLLPALFQNMTISNITAFTYFKRGEINDLANFIAVRDQDNVHRGVGMLNVSLLRMYVYIMQNLYPKKYFNKKWIKMEVRDSNQLFYSDKRISKQDWEKANWHTYDLIVPLQEKNSVFQYALRDINKYSGFIGEFGKRTVKCYVLQTIGDKESFRADPGRKADVIYEKGNRYIQNMPMSDLVHQLQGDGTVNYPVVDETGYIGNIDLKLPNNNSDIKAMQAALLKAGLKLFEANREIELFIIRDKN